ncbi:phosphoribosylformylglycinamidine synthase II [Rubrobacter radiotolerans]|uniref:Phosphoribosylformylglycinamidine synthase subunit PurL n=1 Tax=Rubrobacter radiotolerans TaxID=42256 RepID=A0A023X1I7_RUBRA|nr:phosphoribosylformylglycinamidine synthase subunit PurL [Rubrobacter radiotolerans]AHY46193.1 phosphoribosylformylglycinamidine synthase II [Rubrobacter radiotolerans]MDX5893602.1 phosphoribosylformylglycinamidine synthase subunit PurL [Rubrobacter radiotolerans]SMC04091.1 phosphoribosylformylglycinamidine synthase subunit II [Rubrobacter radiotolerans DSM 5868]
MDELTIRDTYTALGLSDFEYDRILELMGRAPNYLELSLFSVMWSEHCGYKNSRPLLGRFPNDGERVLQGPGENAGVVEVGDGWAVAFKMESHNHPSAVEPYEGAATGAGGIIRDILAMGARPVALLDSLRFGPTEGDSPEASRNRYLLREVVRGIGGYGNAVGVPTVGGEVVFDASYSGNPLVNAMCVGLIRVEDVLTARATGEGNLVVLIGSKTGRDGIHGATFASDELSEESESKRSNVQVGDPFTEKMVIECCLKLLEEGLLVSLQDLGAAGITSSASEMAAKGGVGIEIETDKVPLRESGMEPWEVMISESQERMLAIIEPDKRDEVLVLTERYGLVGAVVGRVADHGELRVLHDGETVGSVPAEYLADAPTYEREVVRPEYLDELPEVDLNKLPEPESFNEALLKLLASPNIRSKHSVYEQYDSEVQTNTVVRPGADAAVMRIKGTRHGFAVATDGRGRHCYLDPRGGGTATVLEAYRNLSCIGAEPVAVTDCLNFGNPEKPDGYFQLAECIEGISLACEALGTPVVSGNVSLYNETERGAIHPTPIVGMVGVLDDVSKHATLGFKREGDMVIVVGDGSEVAFDGSEYLATVHGATGGAPPRPDPEAGKAVSDLVREAVRSGLIDTAHDVSGGGEIVALAEMALAGGVGFAYREDEVGRVIGDQGRGRADLGFFGEGSASFVLAFPEERWEDVREALGGFACEPAGTVGGDRFVVPGLVDLPLTAMKEAYERDLFE